jgi:hypothetical protein
MTEPTGPSLSFPFEAARLRAETGARICVIRKGRAMTVGNPAIYILLVLLFVYVGSLWVVLARRRRARIAAVKAALIRRKTGDAWDRLGKSPAGAP